MFQCKSVCGVVYYAVVKGQLVIHAWVYGLREEHIASGRLRSAVIASASRT